MRICYICSDPGIPVFGRKGCSTHVRELCLALVEAGHDVRLICSNAEGDEHGRDKLNVFEVKAPTSKKLGFGLRRILLDRRIEETADAMFLTWKPDAIYERYSLYGGAGLRLAKRHQTPHIVEVNSILSEEQSERLKFPWLARRTEKRVFRKAQYILTLTEALRETVQRVRASDEESVGVMPMAVDLERFNPRVDGSGIRRELGLEEKFVIGYVGTLTGWHGIKYMYRLAEELRRRNIDNFEVVVVGGDKRRVNANRRKVETRGLEGFMRFMGAVAHAEVPKYMRAFDVALIPDSTPHSSPSKLFEYQGCGAAIVAPAYDAVLDAMEPNVDGLTFEPGNIEEMAEAVYQLYANPALRVRLGRQARMRVQREDVTWRRHASRVVKLFERLEAEQAHQRESQVLDPADLEREAKPGKGLKVLYICADPGVPVFGRKGCSTHVRGTCVTLQELGHDVRLVCANASGDGQHRERLKLVLVEPAKAKLIGFDLRHIVTNWRVRMAARELIRRWKPDVIYERYSLYSTTGGALAKEFGLPHVMEVNALITQEMGDRMKWAPLARWAERRAIRQAQHVVVVSEPLVEEVAAIRGGRETIDRMPIAVNLKQFSDRIDGREVREALGLGDKFVLGYVGTLTGWHGIKLLHRLAQKLRDAGMEDFQILVVGGDSRRLRINRKRVADKGLEGYINFVGAVPHAEVPKYIRAMDVTIVPDTTYWSAPSKMFEYQSCGVPVMAPDYPGVVAGMEDGGEGLIFTPRNVDEMVEAAMALYRDPERRREMGRRGRARAEREHSWEIKGRRITEIFEGQLGRNGDNEINRVGSNGTNGKGLSLKK